MIRAAGGRPILFPVIEIAEIDDTRALNELIDRLEQFDRAIFVSPNAVYKAMTLITGAARIAAAADLRGSRPRQRCASLESSA